MKRTLSARPTARKLAEYFESWLGTEVQPEQAIVHLVEAGLPVTVIRHLIERGLSQDEVYGIIVNLRTLKHRRSKSQPLSTAESERAVRTAGIQ